MFFIDFRDRRSGRERDINVRNIDQLPSFDVYFLFIYVDI